MGHTNVAVDTLMSLFGVFLMILIPAGVGKGTDVGKGTSHRLNRFLLLRKEFPAFSIMTIKCVI